MHPQIFGKMSFYFLSIHRAFGAICWYHIRGLSKYGQANLYSALPKIGWVQIFWTFSSWETSVSNRSRHGCDILNTYTQRHVSNGATYQFWVTILFSLIEFRNGDRRGHNCCDTIIRLALNIQKYMWHSVLEKSPIFLYSQIQDFRLRLLVWFCETTVPSLMLLHKV